MKKNRILAFLLCSTMILTSPAASFAAEDIQNVSADEITTGSFELASEANAGIYDATGREIMSVSPDLIPDLTSGSIMSIDSETASDNSISENASLFTTVYSGMEPKVQKLNDGSFVAVKGQKVLLGASGSSSDPKVIKPGKGSLGQAKKPGISMVTFGDGSSAQVTVVEPVISIKKLAMSVGDASDVKINANGTEDKGLKVAWMSTNPNVAQVCNGHVVAVGQGSAKVYAVVGGKTFKCNVKVTDKPGSTVIVNTYTNGKAVPIPVKKAKKEPWVVSGNDVATLVKGSQLLGVAPGTTTVSGNTHNILVYSSSTAVENPAVALKAGEQVLLKINGNVFPMWKVKNPAVASVSEWGYVIGESDGTTTATTKIGKTKVTVNITVSGTMNPSPEGTIEYPYISDVISGINNNTAVQIHYNDKGDYYLSSATFRDTPIPNDVTSGEENGFRYDITVSGDAVIKEADTDKYDGTNIKYRDYFRLEGDDGMPRFTQTNVGKTGLYYYIENVSSVDNISTQIIMTGKTVNKDISTIQNAFYNWGVDTTIEDGKVVKTFRRIYIDEATGWVFYVKDDGTAAIIAYDEEGQHDNKPESLDGTKTVYRPGSDEGIPVGKKDANPDPNLNPTNWHDGGDENDPDNPSNPDTDDSDYVNKSAGWRRKHTDPDTGAVFVLDDDKTGAIIVGGKSPMVDADGNITIPDSVHKTALGGSYPVVGITDDMLDNLSPAAEITITGNTATGKKVKLYGDYVQTGVADDGSYVYKHFYHDNSASVLVNQNGSGYTAEVIGSSKADIDRIIVHKTMAVKGKGVESVPVTQIRMDAFNGTSPYTPENGKNLYTELSWATIVIEDKNTTKWEPVVATSPASGFLTSRTAGEDHSEYFWQKLSDGSYRQMFIDLQENPASTGNRDTGATGFVFYVEKRPDGFLQAVITGYDYQNISNYRYAPTDFENKDLFPLYVNKTGTILPAIISDDYKPPYRMVTVTFDPNGGELTDAYKSANYLSIDPYGQLPVPDYPDHKLEGWFTARTGGIKITEESTLTSDSDHVLYAHWKETPTVQVAFDAGIGTLTETKKTIAIGQIYGALPVPELLGYSFAGWYTAKTGGNKVESTTVVTTTSNHTLYARYEAKEITISLDANGGQVNGTPHKTIAYNSTYGYLPSAERENWDFIGWFTAAEGGTEIKANTRVTRTDDHTIYAHWRSLNTYTVTFNPAGGNCSTLSKQVVYSRTYGTLPTPTATGQDFDGWYTGIEGSGDKITSESTVTKTRNHTLYANWKAEEYTLTFNTNGGTCSTASKKVAYNSKYGALPTPKKTSYSFIGWFTAQSGGTEVTAETVLTSANNKTVYARWSERSCTVTFNTGRQGASLGGQASYKQVLYEAPYGTLPTPTASGMTFTGWFTDATSSYANRVTADNIVTTQSNHTLYARWTEAGYTVTFDPNGGTCETRSINVVYNSPYGTFPEPIKPGYLFSGWYTAKTGGSWVSEAHTVKITTNQTLYAHWSADSFIVTYDANGGTCYKTYDPVYYNGKYGTLPTPTRAGYKFVGWYTTKTGGTNITATSVHSSANDITLYAHWTGKSYTLFFNANGGTCSTKSKTVYVGSTYQTLPTPTLKGYTFIGWYTDDYKRQEITSSTKVIETDDSSMKVIAHWDIQQYDLTFDPNGGVCSVTDRKISYGTKYGALPTATRANYKFNGWFTSKTGGKQITDQSTVEVTSNQTLYAQWSSITWIVDFNANGGSVNTNYKIVTQGATYGTLPTPTRTGYKFDGWYTSKATGTGGTVVTASTKVDLYKDITLYAHWEEATHTYLTIHGASSRLTKVRVYETSTKYTEYLSYSNIPVYPGQKVVFFHDDSLDWVYTLGNIKWTDYRNIGKGESCYLTVPSVADGTGTVSVTYYVNGGPGCSWTNYDEFGSFFATGWAKNQRIYLGR